MTGRGGDEQFESHDPDEVAGMGDISGNGTDNFPDRWNPRKASDLRFHAM